MRQGRKRKKSLKGTNLEIDQRTGIYQYRWTCPITGKRLKRSTKMTDYEHAIQAAARIREDIEREQVGLSVFDCWKLELLPLVDKWEAWQRGRIKDAGVKENVRMVKRALKVLGLTRCADLRKVGEIKDKLRLHGEKNDIKTVTLAKRYQKPLKSFSSWLAQDNQVIDTNPLSNWKNITVEPAEAKRRAILPMEMARALLACSYLDQANERDYPQRVLLETLLVTGPRVAALIDRDVEDFDPEELTIHFGKGTKNKKRGAGALDRVTAAKIQSYLGSRRSGPLFLSPKGKRLDRFNTLKVWREAFSLGVIESIWPEDLKPDLNMAFLVSSSLLKKKAVYSKGGNPKIMKRSTKRKARGFRLEVEELMEELGPQWALAMKGVDVHAFRKTHKSWAQSYGVAPTATDKQLGWSNSSSGESALLLGSVVGRKHYLDVASPLFDAGESARAVRILMDQALEKAVRIFGGKVTHKLAHMDEIGPERQNAG